MLLACAFRRPLVHLWGNYVADPKAWTPLANAASAVFASLYWYDFVTDMLLLKDVWPHWPFNVLLVLSLLNFGVSGVVMSTHEFRMARETMKPPAGFLPLSIAFGIMETVKLAFVQYTFGLACIILLMPLLDTIAVLQFVFQDASIRVLRVEDDVDIEAFAHMRDVVKALSNTVPSAIFTSVIYAMGNNPEEGIIYTARIFVVSLLASALFLLWVWCSVLHASETNVDHPGVLNHLRSVLLGKTLVPGKEKNATRDEPRLPVSTGIAQAGPPWRPRSWGFGQLVRGICILTPIPVAVVLERYKN
jgi:hypothetical protein